MKALALAIAATWASWWWTPDQLGQRYFEQGAFTAAAAVFRDPMWIGVSWYRAGEFEKAAQAFARSDTAAAHFNQGNARLLLGKYAAAISCYDHALQQRPAWTAAIENRALAQARAERVEQRGGEMGDQRIGADEIVFDSTAKDAGENTEIAGAGALSDDEIQALWLRRVQTRPADFLRAKFAFQHAANDVGVAP
jgi:Ca-activated chloride channel homolog